MYGMKVEYIFQKGCRALHKHSVVPSCVIWSSVYFCYHGMKKKRGMYEYICPENDIDTILKGNTI